MTVHAVATIIVIDSPDGIERAKSPAGKPFLRVTFEGGAVVDMTTTLAEMLGGVGSGTRQRFEDKAAGRVPGGTPKAD